MVLGDSPVAAGRSTHGFDGHGQEPAAELNKSLVLRYWEEAWNRSDYRVLGDIFADRLAIHFHHRTVLVTPAEHESLIRRWREGFPDLSLSIEDMIAERDRVVVRSLLSGAHMGEFAGVDATGVRISMSGTFISRVIGGKIVERWDEYDLQGVLGRIRAAGGFAAKRTWDGA